MFRKDLIEMLLGSLFTVSEGFTKIPSAFGTAPIRKALRTGIDKG